MLLWWTKRSLAPSSGVMKPYPLLSLNHFTVPVAMQKHLPHQNSRTGKESAVREPDSLWDDGRTVAAKCLLYTRLVLEYARGRGFAVATPTRRARTRRDAARGSSGRLLALRRLGRRLLCALREPCPSRRRPGGLARRSS